MKDIVKSVLGGASLTAVDVGARGDIPPHWVVLDGAAKVIGFEPDPEACAALRARYDSRGHGKMYLNLPIAISAEGGERTLYVTNFPGGSSLLPPDGATLEAYSGHDYVHPVVERRIQTRTLCDVLDELGEPRSDLIKADVQGGELEVVCGLGEQRLKTTLVLELEAALEQPYRDAATLFTLQEYLSAKGFKLFGAHPWRGHRIAPSGENYASLAFGVHEHSPTIQARLLYVDAVFVRDPDSVISAGDPETVRRLAAILCAYRYFTEAWHLVERAEAAGLLDAGACRDLRHGMRAWHASLRFSSVFHKPTRFWGLVRLATKAVGMVDRIGDEIAAGRSSDVLDRVRTRVDQARQA